MSREDRVPAELEITPEMIEAGLGVLTWYDPDRDTATIRRMIVTATMRLIWASARV